jgi:hypothetical protein
MDETSRKLLNNSFLTIADRGAKGISCLLDGDPKACITVIATINAVGEKLLLWAIAKGKTERCERGILDDCARQVDNAELIVTHQPSGWTGREVAMHDLQWLADRYCQQIVLVWDLFARITIIKFKNLRGNSAFD